MKGSVLCTGQRSNRKGETLMKPWKLALFYGVFVCLSIGCRLQENTWTINYANSLEQAITLAHIDLTDPKITSDAFHKNETEIGKKTVTSRIFTYENSVSAEFVKADMQSHRFRAATVYELLAFANTFPKATNDNLIALGTVWQHGADETNVVTITLKHDGRVLSLFNYRLRSSLMHGKEGLFGTQSWFLGLKEVPELSTEPKKSQ